ncbi:MAG: MFS transporter [Pseudomonadota bacterium]
MTDTEVTNKNMLPAERRAVARISTVGMLRMFGLFALLPVLAPYVESLDGATPLLIGLAVGGYGLTQALLQIPMGALSDRIGRVPVILFGLSLFAAGSLIAAFADGIHGIVAGRMLQGAGAISASLGAMVADASRDSVRTRSMAIFGVGVGLAFMLAMGVGPLVASWFGVRSLFLVGAASAGLAAVLLLSVPKADRGQVRAQNWSFSDAFRPSLLRIDLYIFILHAVLTATFVALPFVLLNRLDLPVTQHWTIYIGALLASLLVTVPLIYKDDHQGRRSTVLVAVGFLLVSQLMLAFTSFSVWTVFVAVTCFFAGFNFLEAALPARVTTISGDDARGAALGVFSSSQFLGAFTGGLVGGALIGGGSPAPVFFACVLMLLIWLTVQSFASGAQETAQKAEEV